ncbi:MAG: hypothetical protein AABY22_00580 [Nanoarchaeota archaeon]
MTTIMEKYQEIKKMTDNLGYGDSNDCKRSEDSGCQCEKCLNFLESKDVYDIRGWLPLSIAEAKREGLTEQEVIDMVLREYADSEDRYFQKDRHISHTVC